MGDECPADTKRVRHAFWLIVIGFSLSALGGGFLSGRAAVPRFPTAPPPSAVPAVDTVRGIPQTDELAADQFASDDAVSVQTPGGPAREDATLSIVIVDAGRSQALEEPFLSLNVPVTLVVESGGTASLAMTKIAAASGDAVYVQAHAPLQASEVRALRQRFPQAAGVAVRIEPDTAVDAPALGALHASHLALFDEYGENAPLRKSALAAGVRYAARSVTVDDHAERTYVAYMLRQAVHLARARRAIVMARPFPGTLQAFRDLLARARREGIRFAALP